MRIILVAVVLAIVLTACASEPRAERGTMPVDARDGSSLDKAIVVYAGNEQSGNADEYMWLGWNFPGFTRRRQELIHRNGRYYDLVEFDTASGQAKKVYFDITSFYGKW